MTNSHEDLTNSLNELLRRGDELNGIDSSPEVARGKKIVRNGLAAVTLTGIVLTAGYFGLHRYGASLSDTAASVYSTVGSKANSAVDALGSGASSIRKGLSDWIDSFSKNDNIASATPHPVPPPTPTPASTPSNTPLEKILASPTPVATPSPTAIAAHSPPPTPYPTPTHTLPPTGTPYQQPTPTPTPTATSTPVPPPSPPPAPTAVAAVSPKPSQPPTNAGGIVPTLAERLEKFPGNYHQGRSLADYVLPPYATPRHTSKGKLVDVRLEYKKVDDNTVKLKLNWKKFRAENGYYVVAFENRNDSGQRLNPAVYKLKPGEDQWIEIKGHVARQLLKGYLMKAEPSVAIDTPDGLKIMSSDGTPHWFGLEGLRKPVAIKSAANSSPAEAYKNAYFDNKEYNTPGNASHPNKENEKNNMFGLLASLAGVLTFGLWRRNSMTQKPANDNTHNTASRASKAYDFDPSKKNAPLDLDYDALNAEKLSIDQLSGITMRPYASGETKLQRQNEFVKLYDKLSVSSLPEYQKALLPRLREEFFQQTYSASDLRAIIDGTYFPSEANMPTRKNEFYRIANMLEERAEKAYDRGELCTLSELKWEFDKKVTQQEARNMQRKDGRKGVTHITLDKYNRSDKSPEMDLERSLHDLGFDDLGLRPYVSLPPTLKDVHNGNYAIIPEAMEFKVA